MTTIRILLAFSLLGAAACDGEANAKTNAAPAAGDEAAAEAKPGVDYSEIDAKIAAAKTGDQWTEIVMACGSLEIDAAMNGTQNLADTPEYNQHCGTSLELARAKQAIELSTPDKMHDTCISASMGMEGLIEKGKEVEKAKAMLADVNKACGF